MRRLGAKSITALVVTDREVAWQILALNTEKAHNLKERSLEVIRILEPVCSGKRRVQVNGRRWAKRGQLLSGRADVRFPNEPSRVGVSASEPLVRRICNDSLVYCTMGL